VISRSSIGFTPAHAGIWAACALVAILAVVACSDAIAPDLSGPAIRIVPVADSVFEGDTVHLAAQVFDEAGAAAPTATVTWMVSDTTLAEVVGEGIFALLRPGTVRITARSGLVAATYDLAIGGLVVKRVELTPETISLGRTDRLPVAARVVGQGGRPIPDRTVTFTSDDTLVAIVPGPVSISSPNTGLLIAVGPGSTTIRARVDGVIGTASVGVMVVDTTFTLTEYNGSPLPVLVEADSVVLDDGSKTFYEIYAGPGTLVLSGLIQKRYQVDVQYSVYEVIHTGNTERRELRLQVRGQFDRGLVTVGANGGLTMLSELIGPHLEHTATLQSDGYLVHYRVPGENFFLDLRYRRVTP
jgi:hypothetical protein